MGFSNARANPVLIFREPEDNVPAEVHDALDWTLKHAHNVRNRANKRSKFGFRTSEDAVTWTVFSFLARSKQLESVLSKLLRRDAEPRTVPPILLLWGVPLPATEAGLELAQALSTTCDALKEDCESRSEPDVLIKTGSGDIVAIEVKYRSSDDVKAANHGGWARYTEGRSFRKSAGVIESGLYELARNWRIAWDLAGPRACWLFALGREELSAPRHENRLKVFRSSLPETAVERFRLVTWKEMISAIPERPHWLDAFLVERELLETPHDA